LEGLKGLVVLDEVQRKPDLFPFLRVMADRRPLRCKFLILGSANPWLMKRTSESLAGRVRFIEMGGFSPVEVGWNKMERLWMRGGFPGSFLSATEKSSLAWREDFIQTFLERDIPQLEIRVPPVTLGRFLAMVAHYHGQVWNASEIGASLGFSHNTARRYLDALTGAFTLRQLAPYFVNAGKRLVKAPKIYVRDSGLLHALLGIRTMRELESNPKLGASWEGFALELLLEKTGSRNAYFWATHAGAELDLVLDRGGKRWGFEFKVSKAPSLTKSMRIALDDLRLERLWVIHTGEKAYPLDKRVTAISLWEIEKLPKVLWGG
jgi:predicted AAA+ superfamily ATPase